MTKEDKAVLIAVCIGDGSLEKTSKYSVRLKVEHSTKQQEYNEWKLDRIHSIVGGKKPKMSFAHRMRKSTPVSSCYFRFNYRYFRVIRKWLYNPTKVLRRTILDKLTPEALAIWFMDDGNTERSSKNSFRITLSCDAPYEEVEIIQEYFGDRWGIKWNINKSGRFYRLRCSTKEARKFFDLISPFVVPSMRYKLNVQSHLWHECGAS